jgi:hypothetical protein
MKKRFLILVLLAVLLAFPLVIFAQGGPPADPSPPEQFPGNKDPLKAVPNLSFPIITTDIIQMFYEQTFVDENENGIWDEGEEWILLLDETTALPIPIEVEEVISDDYNGSYEGYSEEDNFYTYDVDSETGCAMDINSWDEFGEVVEGVPDGVIDDADRLVTPMLEWLADMEPWYDQPVFILDEFAWDPNLIWNIASVDTSDLGGANSWQAEWYWTGDLDGDPATVDPVAEDFVIEIDFIDWGNPMENINPIVGQRFPVEVALYEKVADWVDGTGLTDTSMAAYKMACLENSGSKDEVFGTSSEPAPDTGGYIFQSAFATVLTSNDKFIAEVWNPDGTITPITLEPGIGPSGKMNFASGGGGWIPTMPGWHRVWLHLNDPQISLEHAIVNNDEHYVMSSGCMAQELSENKQELSGIIGDSTFIDVLVERPSGKRK